MEDISRVNEVNKRIDKDINDFKLYVQQKYNKKYTDLAYGNIKNAKYYQGLGELSVLRDIAILSDDFFDHTKDNFKNLSENYLQTVRERDDLRAETDSLRAEITELKGRLKNIEKSEINPLGNEIKAENYLGNEKASERIMTIVPDEELNKAIADVLDMEKATPSFLKGFAYALEDPKFNDAVAALARGYAETFMTVFPEYHVSKNRVLDSIYDAILYKDKKISNELLNDKNVIDIYRNNSRNVERLLQLDDYVKNPEKLDRQNNLIQIKKYGAVALKSALVENVFTDKLFESLYEDIKRQFYYEEGRPDETLSHLYDSEEYHKEQEFLKELIEIEPVYVDHTGTGFLVFNDNDNKFLPDRIDIKTASSAISFAHVVSTFLETHKDVLPTLLTDMDISKEAKKVQIDRAVLLYKDMEESITEAVKEYDRTMFMHKDMEENITKAVKEYKNGNRQNEGRKNEDIER